MKADILYSLFLFLMIVISLFLCSSFNKSSVKNLDVVLCIDTSKSMNYSFGKCSRIDIVKEAAIMFIKSLPPETLIGVVRFSSDSQIVLELTEDRNLSINEIATLQPKGRTAMGDGILSALDVLSRGRNDSLKVIILLTDGAWNEGRNPNEALQKAISMNVTIYTIGIGDLSTGEFNPEILEKLARNTKGIYYEVDLSKGIEESRFVEILTEIAQRLTGRKDHR